MDLGQLEWWIGQLVGVSVAVTLGVIFAGIFRGIKRFRGTNEKQPLGILLRPLFYVLAGVGFFILCWWIWLPLIGTPPIWLQVVGLIVGVPLIFGGTGLILWGRLTLGSQYFVSTSWKALLFTEHRLVTTGPFAIIRHPMYLGILMIGLGGTLFYRTWTMVFISLMYLGLRIRARREDEALSKRFGEQWQEYQRSVPAWLPKIKIKGKS